MARAKKAPVAKPVVDEVEDLLEDESTDETEELTEASDDAGEAETEEKPEKVVVEIIRGRMPVAVVAAIKFGTHKDAKDADLAAQFRTTNGKISDIRGNRNFAYIDKNWKPSQADVDAAQKYVEQLDRADDVNEMIAALGVATAEEAKANLEARKATRKTPGKAKAKKEAKAEVEAEEVVEDDDAEAVDELDDLLDD